MPVVERELTGFELPSDTPQAGQTVKSFTVVSNPNAVHKGFGFTLSFPLPNAYRVLLTGPDRPPPPHDNVVLRDKPCSFEVVSVDDEQQQAVLSFPTGPDIDREREIHLSWTESICVSVWESAGGKDKTMLLSDIDTRSYALTEHGIVRHWHYDRAALHLGLGEKGAPLDLSLRNFSFSGTDAAHYDAYKSDPLYKHTPYLIVAPRPTYDKVTPSTYAIYHPTNSNVIWDINRHNDEPWTKFQTYTQDWGGLEEWVLVGKGVREVVHTFAKVVGKPKLVGRDWLGYLASGMGLGESDDPPAQKLLETWPGQCREHDIPCSAMHLSSGYTVDAETGNRWVFTMNKKRYPDFGGMVKHFHKAGIKLVPNVKPYILDSHPSYGWLYDKDAMNHDPFTDKPVVTRIWASGEGQSAKGGWSDLTSKAGRQWWHEGVQTLVDLGVDGIWNDNNEFYLHDDEFLAKNEFPHELASPAPDGPVKIGALGRMINVEMMAKVSERALVEANPERRPYVLTRSANVGTFKYACATWTGDNETSWHNMRGSQAIQLNCGLSLIQSTGTDVGGFGGPLPSPELFVRWVQLGVTHARFCIHSWKPNTNDPHGVQNTNTPWMFPEVLPIVRKEIKWRYEYLPFFNSLMWDSHLNANPTNAWLAWGDFGSDPELYTEEIMNGFDAWIGAGQLLSAPALFEGVFTRQVYFPRSSQHDKSLYFDLNAPFGVHTAGTRSTITVPIEHAGLFAREGAVIPVGKDYHTVTQLHGPSRTTIDGIDVVLEKDGGVVGLDDWRGVQIFPGPGASYQGHWIEDDGISSDPGRTVVQVKYSTSKGDNDVSVSLKFLERDFKAAWENKVTVILPISDKRGVKGGKQTSYKGRPAWVVEVS